MTTHSWPCGEWDAEAREHVVTPAGLMPRCTESNPTLGRCDRLEGHASAHHVYGWWWKEDDVREDITETHDGT